MTKKVDSVDDSFFVILIIANSEAAYAPNLHCKWSIERPRFRGIDVRIVYADLEVDPACEFDYIAITASLGDANDAKFHGDDLTHAARYCDNKLANMSLKYSSSKVTKT